MVDGGFSLLINIQALTDYLIIASTKIKVFIIYYLIATMKEAHILKKRGPKNRLNAVYKKITHSDRIAIIYLRHVHNYSLHKLESSLNVKYNSIRNILKAYDESGRTNKKAYFKDNRVLKSQAKKAQKAIQTQREASRRCSSNSTCP